MRVEPTKQAAFEQQMSGFAHQNASEHSAGDRPQGRALVATEPAAPAPVARPRQACFLAHLIATKEQAPQTRERRRAEPTEAIAAYRAVAAITG